MADRFVPFHAPDIGDEEIAAVSDALRSGWLTKGPRVIEFESAFADYVGASHAVAVNSGTSALHLALEGIGVREHDEVIVPTMTFAACAEVVLYLRARPVLVDCTPETFNIDPEAIERAVSSRTKAIMPVHFAGWPCEMDRIKDIAARRRLRIIEDAAHALPARYKETAIGAIGDVTAFSFYATKTLTTGEGGMATTADPDVAERMRVMSLHGISKDAWKRYTAEGSWYYEVIAPGFKYNMTDIQAALGLVQLKRCDGFWQRRRQIADAYRSGFKGCEAVAVPEVRVDGQHAWHLYVIRLHLERLSIDRHQFIAELKSRGIGTSVHFIPLHLHPYYRKTYGYRVGDFPVAEHYYERCISLPIYPRMRDADISSVVGAVWDVVGRFRR